MKLIELNPQTSFSEITRFIHLLYGELFGEEALLSEDVLKQIQGDLLKDERFHKAYKVTEGDLEVGFFTLSDSFSFFAHGRYGIINELWVSPECRSGGYGGKILNEIKKLAAEQNWERVDVSAPPFERWQRTFEFYQKYGFVFTGKKLKWIAG